MSEIIAIQLTEELSGQWLPGYANREKITSNKDGLNDRLEILGIELSRMANYDNSWEGTASRNLRRE